MESVHSIKQRFGIIGNDPHLNRTIEKVIRVAPTDISVIITGESGVGKEHIPKIIHQLSFRKHSKYIAVNCGAIPEGTIDSELFGHEKGSFTGATSTRKGYFEVANGGTVFLDEVGELPLTTQVRLLRILENGEFIKVGSSQVQKTNVRIVAATNLKIREAVIKKKFREDLFYRLSTVEITLPPLRDRSGDIHLLFRKFASDFAQRYNMPTIRLTNDAINYLNNYSFPGNIRQLRNVAEQISVVEEDRIISREKLVHYLPNNNSLPSVVSNFEHNSDFASEREIMYKILFDMKNDISDLKKLTVELLKNGSYDHLNEEHRQLIEKIYNSTQENKKQKSDDIRSALPVFKISKEITNNSNDTVSLDNQNTIYSQTIEGTEEHMSLREKKVQMIKKSLERHNGKRKLVAKELGISERTLYRKIKQYNL